MDIICPRCAEPCDVFELHEFDVSFETARKTFFDVSKGCGVLFTDRPCAPSDDPRAAMSAALADLLGDDVDGIASMTEDMELFL